jgi:hypothetical protein
MTYNRKSAGLTQAAQGGGGGSYPIARSFAVFVLLALGLLVVLRHLFGSVQLSVGARG